MATDTSKSHFTEALKEMRLGNFTAAEHYLELASELNEESTTLYAASWAVLLALRDREEEAISILEERLAVHSTDTNLLLAYGITLEKQKKFEDAEDAFREVLSREPKNPGALRGLSDRMRQKGDMMEAAKLAVQAFTEAPDNIIFAKTAADMLELIDQPKTAFEVLEIAAHHHPEDEEMVCRALQGCFANNLLDRAREILVIVDINQPWAAGWKASFLDWQGEHAKADELLNRTLTRAAGSDPGFLFQAACIAMRRGDTDLADTYVSRILEQDPQHTGALRISADLSLGRTDLDAAIDPLMKAFALSSDTLTGWQLFWSCVVSGRFEEAEETIATLAEDEEILYDPVETSRLELAEVFLYAAQGSEAGEVNFSTLEVLPDDLTCCLLIEFLEAIEEFKGRTEELDDFYRALYEQLAKRNPVLRLNRLYARSSWLAMNEALEELYASIMDGEPLLGFEQTENVHRLYSLLTAMATQDQERVKEFSDPLEEEMLTVLVDILGKRAQRNPTEQRWLDGLRAEIRTAAAPAPLEPTPTPTGTNVAPEGVGSIVNTQNVEIVYQTEDGEILTELDDDEYEIVAEGEIDPEDENYEYVWVKEEVEVPVERQDPNDTFS